MVFIFANRLSSSEYNSSTQSSSFFMLGLFGITLFVTCRTFFVEDEFDFSILIDNRGRTYYIRGLIFMIPLFCIKAEVAQLRYISFWRRTIWYRMKNSTSRPSPAYSIVRKRSLSISITSDQKWLQIKPPDSIRLLRQQTPARNNKTPAPERMSYHSFVVTL